MSDNDEEAQQMLVKAIGARKVSEEVVVLCRTPGKLAPVDGCYLGIFDQFHEFVTCQKHLTLILPRPGSISSKLDAVFPGDYQVIVKTTSSLLPQF